MAPIKNPIKRLPVKGSSSFATVRVVPMTRRLLNIWHDQIQPLIDQNYSTHPCDPDERIRADVGWNWKTFSYHALAHDAAFVANKNRSTIKLCVVAVPEDPNHTPEEYFPIGMLILVPKFECNTPTRADRAFTWYMSNAPREAYDHYLKDAHGKGVRIEGVAKMLLDCVVQAAIDIQADGTMLLRAATEGGKHLKRFYGDCRLRSLGYNNGPISFVRRKNPEEYFLLNKTNANIMARHGDPLRV